MKNKSFCDRCDSELYVTHTLRAAVISDISGFEQFALCEKCAVELREWIVAYGGEQ